MQQELIIIEQLPIIREKLRTLSEEIDARTTAALSLECTEENKQTVKKERAALTKEFAEYEERRKQVKTAIMTPYEQFEEAYNEFVSSKFKAADEQLKARIDAVEKEQKKRLETAAREYFDEYAQSKDIDFLTFEMSKIKVGVSSNKTNLCKQCAEFIDRISDDLALIDTNEHKDEILVEYKRSLNCSQAITTILQRHKAIEEQKRLQLEREERLKARRETAAKVETAVTSTIPKPLNSPTTAPIQHKLITVTFKVTDTRERLLELKQFLDDRGYKYE